MLRGGKCNFSPYRERERGEYTEEGIPRRGAAARKESPKVPRRRHSVVDYRQWRMVFCWSFASHSSC